MYIWKIAPLIHKLKILYMSKKYSRHIKDTSLKGKFEGQTVKFRFYPLGSGESLKVFEQEDDMI